LSDLIEIYKYKSVRACGVVLANLLNEVADFTQDMRIVPLPTIMKHVRERGFDHTAKLAHYLARANGLRVAEVLARGNNAVQVGASEEKRKEQAKTAYIAKPDIDQNENYLLLDDVWTTGSSMLAACNALRQVGCKNINIAVLAKSD
jgi:ComF family protein